MKTFAVALAIVVSSVGCTTVGRKFDPTAADSLQPGASTMEATNKLGPASAQSTYPDGSQLLQWQYAQGSLFGGSGAHIAILFDKSGRMVRVTHRSQAQ